MKTYMLTKADGTVAIMGIIDGSNIDTEIEKWKLQAEQHELPLQRVIEINPAVIPQDRTFRAAWADITPQAKVDIDMDKAREIKLAQIREWRKPLLNASDIEMTRALETGDSIKVQELREYRQSLRDITETLLPDIEAAETTDALKAITPSI